MRSYFICLNAVQEADLPPAAEDDAGVPAITAYREATRGRSPPTRFGRPRSLVRPAGLPGRLAGRGLDASARFPRAPTSVRRMRMEDEARKETGHVGPDRSAAPPAARRIRQGRGSRRSPPAEGDPVGAGTAGLLDGAGADGTL